MLSEAPITVRRFVSARRKRKRDRRQGREPAAARRVTRRAEALHETRNVERLAYTRRQAAEALGLSLSTIDRRVVPLLDTVKTPWGQRLIPVTELERFLSEHIRTGRPLAAPRRAGRRPLLQQTVVERIQLEYARRRSLGAIARGLTADNVPTAHGGRCWWPSTVRDVLLRSDPLPSADTSV